MERTFDLESFYAQVGATAKEHHALRQDLVRALKDYFEIAYGYDRYGAETIFQLAERMAEPYVFGFGALRVLRDRRISEQTKGAVSRHALDLAYYDVDEGLPFAFFSGLHFLASHSQLSVTDLRYALVMSAGELEPFTGLDKPETLEFFRWILDNQDVPVAERIFWGHSLISRHRDLLGASELVNTLLANESLPLEDRREVCQAWINFRQPRTAVDLPDVVGNDRDRFVAEHLPFWVAHMPSWPTPTMVRLALVWLSRLGANPGELAESYIDYRGPFSDQIHGSVAEVITEHRATIPRALLRDVIEKGIAISGSMPTRRKFYQLGRDLFGPEYLERATSDAANSVRQWAAKQLLK